MFIDAMIIQGVTDFTGQEGTYIMGGLEEQGDPPAGPADTKVVHWL